MPVITGRNFGFLIIGEPGDGRNTRKYIGQKESLPISNE